eukprot:12766-Heterococcus_DN1.PRE.2
MYWHLDSGSNSVVHEEPLASALDKLPFQLHTDTRQTLVQGAAGYCAGATTVLLTNPLDVIRTRLQVNGGNSSTTATATATTAAASSTASSNSANSRGGAAAAASASATVNRATMWSEAKALWATDGAKALLRGIGPRVQLYQVVSEASMCVVMWLILTYALIDTTVTIHNRMIAVAPASILIVTTYEFIKKCSRKQPSQSDSNSNTSSSTSSSSSTESYTASVLRRATGSRSAARPTEAAAMHRPP